jgi:phage repressor protein C with HTH and peptisase S24 domain
MRATPIQQRIEEILRDQQDQKLTATQLGRLLGVSKGRVSQLRKDGSLKSMSYAGAKRLAQKYGYSMDWLIDGEGPKFQRGRSDPGRLADFVFIDRYRSAAHSAGPGEVADEGDGEVDQIVFREDWLRSKGWNPRHLKAAPARGRSMEPRIQDGDLLLIDTSDKEVKSGRIYAFWQERSRRVKRLFVGVDKSLRIRSDNPAPQFAEELVPTNKTDQIEIIGRVVWAAGAIE